jgi:hypothetical protein
MRARSSWSAAVPPIETTKTRDAKNTSSALTASSARSRLTLPTESSNRPGHGLGNHPGHGLASHVGQVRQAPRLYFGFTFQLRRLDQWTNASGAYPWEGVISLCTVTS